MICAAAGGILLTVALLLRQVELSGAIPADEFGPAILAYGAIVPLQMAACLLFTVSLLRQRREASIGLLPIGTLLMAGGVVHAALLPLGALLVLCARMGGLDAHAAPWPRFSLRFVLADLWCCWFPVLGAAVFLGFFELGLFTDRFFEQGILQQDLHQPYAFSLIGFATLSAVKVIWIFFRLTLVAVLLAFLPIRRLRRRPAVFDAVMASAAVASILFIFWQTMEDEVMGLEALAPPSRSVLLFFSALIPLGATLLGPWLLKVRARQVRDALGFGCARYFAGLVPSGTPARSFASLLALSLLFFGLRYALYPEVEDYRTKMFDSLAHFAILIGAALFVPFSRPMTRKAAHRLAVVLTLVGLVSCGWFVQRPDVRLIAFEYSRFCALGASAPWAGLTVRHEVVGFNPPSGSDPFATSVTNSAVTGVRTRPPVFLIVWDAARPDRCSAYGYERDTTPHLSALAADGVLFQNARSTATATTLSVRNMMTGCYSSRYMMSEQHAPFFVNRLYEGGYDRFFVTVTGNDNNGVSGESFLRSWDSASARPCFRMKRYSNRDEIKPDREKTDDLIEYLRETKSASGSLDQTFCYLHLTSTHSPWVGENSVRSWGNSPLDRYDSETALVDHLLGKLVAELKELEVYDESVILVTSDHGTGLGEHGRLTGFLPYEEQLRIPLVVKGPGIKPAESMRAVANIDIAPTVLEYLGLSSGGMDGRSFADILIGSPTPQQPRPLVAFCAFRDGYAVYDPDGRYKLHHHRSNGYEALFDLRNDPGEFRNLLREKPAEASRLRRHLDHFLWRGRKRYGNPYHYKSWDLGREQER